MLLALFYHKDTHDTQVTLSEAAEALPVPMKFCWLTVITFFAQEFFLRQDLLCVCMLSAGIPGGQKKMSIPGSRVTEAVSFPK